VLNRTENPEEYQETDLVTRHTLKEEKRRRFRILLVEDNPTNQMVAVTVLGKLGYQAYAVDNGREALKVLEEEFYDLILMDCQMPEMDGYETTREIRKREAQKISSRGSSGACPTVIPNRTPIIALTAHAMTGDRERCISSGMDDFIAKPVNPRKMAEVIEKWLEKPAEAEAAAEDEPVIEDALPEKAVFDRVALTERLMGDEDLVNEVTATFLEDIDILVLALKEAVSKGDTARIVEKAHTIKGAAGNVCAFALQETAFRMEEAAEANQPGTPASLMPILEEQLELLKKAMEG
jgi:CheY-like chemotaxis protein/HPt (histidine-containing phosphotransfer) domain-containing protein